MRIALSNPDSIGDFVLRQPFYAALAAAGHELFLVVRSAVMPLAALIAPDATISELTSDPYSPEFDSQAPDVQNIVASARQFAPDIFCITPYQRTAFDEYLAGVLKPRPTAGMDGLLYRGDINAGLDCRTNLKLDRAVSVPADVHELLKNERLCALLLGRNVKLPDPRIVAESRQREVAETALRQLGVKPGTYWIGCVGHNRYTAVRNWTVENWARALSHAVAKFGRRFLLIGSEDERATTEEIRARMGEAAAWCENLAGACGSIDLAVGLIHHSAGYMGRDTGPMHIAAALGKPVIAIFGGGTWPRFTPATRTGVALTVTLPCAGCDWQCHLAESYCVKRVALSAVLDSIDSLEAGRIEGTSIQQLDPDSALLARVAREGAASAREFWRTAARQGRQTEIPAGDNSSTAFERELAVEIQRISSELSMYRAEESEQMTASSTNLDALWADLDKLVERGSATRPELVSFVSTMQLEWEASRRSTAAAQKALSDCQAENARNSALAEELQRRALVAETACEAAAMAAEKARAELDSIMVVRANLESQLQACESERAAASAELERQAAQLRDASQEINCRTDEYQKLLALMHGVTGEIALLSRQLVHSRRVQEQVERECASLRRSIETSLALRLARSLHWAVEPALKFIRRTGISRRRS